LENKDGRDAGKDTGFVLRDRKAAQVDGIALDVRDDGGGSLSTVVDIADCSSSKVPLFSSNQQKKERSFI
jgi:carboxyl-terminal processing protease